LVVWSTWSVAALAMRVASTILMLKLVPLPEALPVAVKDGCFVLDTRARQPVQGALAATGVGLVCVVAALARCLMGGAWLEHALWVAFAMLTLDLSFDTQPVVRMCLYYATIFGNRNTKIVPPILIASALGCAASLSWRRALWPAAALVGVGTLLLLRRFVDPRMPLPGNPDNVYAADSLLWAWVVLAMHLVFMAGIGLALTSF
jgi:hypothetical protein